MLAADAALWEFKCGKEQCERVPRWSRRAHPMTAHGGEGENRGEERGQRGGEKRSVRRQDEEMHSVLTHAEISSWREWFHAAAAHFSAHVFDSLEKRGYRVQSHAGVVTAFNSAIDVGRLHTGGHSCEACRPSGGGVAGLFLKCGRRITRRWGSDWLITKAKQGHKKGAECALFAPSMGSRERD